MYSTPRPTKTYGRKLSMKDRHGTSTVFSQHPNQSTDDEGPPRKRRTLLTSEDSIQDNDEVRYSQTSSRKIVASVSRSISPESNSSKQKEKEREVTRHLNESTNVPPESSSAPQSSFSTPKKSQGPKDLWEIFNAVSPSPSKAQKRPLQRTSSIKPSGLAKRMLSRSRTESSIESSLKSQEEILPRSYSMADSPSRSTVPSAAGPSRFREKPESQNDQEYSQSSTSEPSGSQIKDAKNVRRTYAGQSRSFLLALPASSLLGGQNGSKAENLDDDDDSLRDSYQELRRRWGVDNSEQDSMHVSHDHSTGSTGEGLYNPLFSITDLRSKGESRRFMDEIGYLFEGLAPTSALSVRRSSAFDIITKLCNQEFWRKTRAAGLIGEIWDQLRAAEAGNGDKVLDSIMCCFVSLATEEPRDISPLAAKNDFVSTVIRLLETHYKKDPFAMSRTRSTSPQKKGSNTSDMMMIKRINDVIGKMLNITREECQPSVRLLLSNAFAAAPHLAFPHISIVMDSLVGDLSSLLKRLTAYRSGLPLLPESGSDSLCLCHIHNCLAILDSFLLGGQSDDDTHGLSKSSFMTSYPELEAGLTAVTVAMNILEQTLDFVSLQLHVSRCSDLAFRVLINLTNDDPEWVNAVVSDEYTLPTLLRLVTTSFRTMSQIDSKKIVREGDEEYARSMDKLCLSLALLTNLAQESKNLTSSLQATKHASSCLGTRKCLAGCCCENGVDSLASLVNIYISLLKREEDSSEQTEADFNFLRGHFAVLLGLLILQGPPRLVIDKLPGSSSKSRLRLLMQNITEFAALYNSVTGRHEVTDDDESEEVNGQSRSLNGQSSHASANDRMNANVIVNVVTALDALQAELK